MVGLHKDRFIDLCARAEETNRLEYEGLTKIHHVHQADIADLQRVIDAKDPVAAIGVNFLESLQKQSQLDVEKKMLENVKTNLENQLLQQRVDDSRRRSLVGIEQQQDVPVTVPHVNILFIKPAGLKKAPTAATSNNFAMMPKLPSVPDRRVFREHRARYDRQCRSRVVEPTLQLLYGPRG
jgi:hypothetical protein